MFKLLILVICLSAESDAQAAIALSQSQPIPKIDSDEAKLMKRAYVDKVNVAILVGKDYNITGGYKIFYPKHDTFKPGAHLVKPHQDGTYTYWKEWRDEPVLVDPFRLPIQTRIICST